MQIISIEVVFASGLKISDNATIDDSQQLHVSDRLVQLLLELDRTEAPPVITVTMDGQSVSVFQRAGQFVLSGEIPEVLPEATQSMCARFLAPFLVPTKDQRQQFGRFLHTLSAASLAGAVGFWHSTTTWTASTVLNELGLAIAFVVTFYRGMVSMKGE
jgi:hypothetical protein